MMPRRLMMPTRHNISTVVAKVSVCCIFAMTLMACGGPQAQPTNSSSAVDITSPPIGSGSDIASTDKIAGGKQLSGNVVVMDFGGLVTRKCGGLPEADAPKALADIQRRVSGLLLNEGLVSELFTDELPDTDSAVGQSGWAKNQDGYFVSYLVVRHLRAVSGKDMTSSLRTFCPSGALYNGYIAGRPHLLSISEAETMNMISAQPYGMLACATGDELIFKVIDTNHAIFNGDFLPNCQIEIYQPNVHGEKHKNKGER